MECALLKIETLDNFKLVMGQQVIAKEDIGMKIVYQDLPLGGEVAINLNNPNPIKYFVAVSPGLKPPLETCGGDKIEISNEKYGLLQKCEESTLQDGAGCKFAVSEKIDEIWTASGNKDENVVLKFNDRVKPQEIWIAQPQEETNMATQVKVFITDDV